jgi:hypothetical protein
VTFEPTDREEVIIRMDLYEAHALAETGLWQLLDQRPALLQAIHETEACAARPKPGDTVTDPHGLLPQGDWWCCSADYPYHAPSCVNYIDGEEAGNGRR